MDKILDSKIFGVLRKYRGLPRGVYILFAIRIINAMGNFVLPFLTIFLTKSIGLSAKDAAWFFSLTSVAFAPGSIIGGKLCDVVGRKKIVVTAQFLSALCLIPCAFLGNSMKIPWIIMMSTFFNGAAQPAFGAMVNDLTDTSNRKSAYSLLYLGNNIGFSVGPMIAGFLYAKHTPLLFLGNGIVSIIVVCIFIKFVRETIPDRNNKDEEGNFSEKEKAEEGSIFEVLLRRPQLIIFTFLAMVYSFVYTQFPYALPIQLNELFGHNGPRLYGIVMFVNGSVVIIFTAIITTLTHEINPLFNISLAGVFFSLGFGMIYFIHSFPMFILSTMVWTIGEILNATNSGVYIANQTPSSHRGRINAVLPLISESGFAISPIVMGHFIMSYGVRATWPLVFVMELTAASLIYSLYVHERKRRATI